MNAVEFWILSCAVEHWIDVHWLAAPGRETFQTQYRPRGAGNEQIVAALEGFYRRGDLRALTWRDVTGAAGIYPIVRPAPTRAEIARGVVEQKRFLGYELTEQGGCRWEEAARPRWEQFWYGTMGTDAEGRWWVEVEAMDAEVVEGHVSLARAEGRLIEGALERGTLAPWEATYWKDLPSGYYVRYQEEEWGRGLSPKEAWYEYDAYEDVSP